MASVFSQIIAGEIPSYKIYDVVRCLKLLEPMCRMRMCT